MGELAECNTCKCFGIVDNEFRALDEGQELIDDVLEYRLVLEVGNADTVNGLGPGLGGMLAGLQGFGGVVAAGAGWAASTYFSRRRT